MKNIEKIISQAINDTEFSGKTFIVGGYIRDQILKIKTSDMDIVVELEDGGRKLAEFLFRKSISSRPVLFENFGTSFVEIEGHKIEFVMTRKESYREKNRKPQVFFGTLKDDILRRDFTINSLAKNIITGDILDLSKKGFSDLENKIVRSTSDPEIIFGEDPLRMLRAVRFSHKFEFRIEPGTEAGIIRNSKKLKYISWERRRDELTKLLLFDKPSSAMIKLDELSLLKNIIPELLELKGIEQGKYHDLDAFRHSLQVLDNSKAELIPRLAALLHDIGKPETMTRNETGIHFYGHETTGAEIAGKILRRLKFSVSDIKAIKFLIKNHLRIKNLVKEENITGKAIRKMIRDCGPYLADLFDLSRADDISHASRFRNSDPLDRLELRIKEIQDNLCEQEFPLNGKDIMEKFSIKSGKKVGQLLFAAEEFWLENPHLDRKNLLELLEKKYSIKD